MYARGTTILPQALADDDFSLVIDQANYASFQVDDVENKQSHVNWEDLATSSMAYSLKDGFDKEILYYMTTQVTTALQYGTNGSPNTVGFASGNVTPLATLNRLARLLDEKNIPSDNRWVIAPPLFWERMADESSKLIGVDWQSSGSSTSILRNGKLLNGDIRGFVPYRSNNLPLSAGSHNILMAGHMSSTSSASQIAKVEKFRSPNAFADVVRGLHLYGRKVLRTDAIAMSTFD